MIRVLPLLLGFVLGCSSHGLPAPVPDGSAPDTAAPVDGPSADLGADTVKPEAAAPFGVRSFVVVAHLEPDGMPNVSPPAENARPPQEETFTVRLDGPGAQLVASRDGTVEAIGLTATAAGWSTANELGVGPATGSLAGRCQGLGRTVFSKLDIVVEGDGIRGTCQGRAEWLSGDAIYSLPFKGTFTGTPDHMPPSLLPLPVKPHAADAFWVRVNEALPASTVARLMGPAGMIVPLHASPENGPMASFHTERALWPGTSYRLVIEPGPVDLAGNFAAELLPPTIDTVAVPLVPADGFEGTTAPYLSGQAAVVGADRLPPISGQRSLYLPPFGYAATFESWRASMRLAVKPGARVVRATARAVMPVENLVFLAPLQLAAISPTGKTTIATVVAKEPPTRIETGPGKSVWLGPPQAIELALPEGTTDEVYIDTHVEVGCGLNAPFLGALVDDLRVE